MLGPDVARALTDPASDFELELLRLTDVVASPHLRDEAQVERTEASAAGDRGGGTAAIPASLPAAFQREGGGGGGEQGVVEYQEVDIAEAEAVEQATQGTDATVVSTLHPLPPLRIRSQPRVTRPGLRGRPRAPPEGIRRECSRLLQRHPCRRRGGPHAVRQHGADGVAGWASCRLPPPDQRRDVRPKPSNMFCQVANLDADVHLVCAGRRSRACGCTRSPRRWGTRSRASSPCTTPST